MQQNLVCKQTIMSSKFRLWWRHHLAVIWLVNTKSAIIFELNSSLMWDNYYSVIKLKYFQLIQNKITQFLIWWFLILKFCNSVFVYIITFLVQFFCRNFIFVFIRLERPNKNLFEKVLVPEPLASCYYCLLHGNFWHKEINHISLYLLYIEQTSTQVWKLNLFFFFYQA